MSAETNSDVFFGDKSCAKLDKSVTKKGFVDTKFPVTLYMKYFLPARGSPSWFNQFCLDLLWQVQVIRRFCLIPLTNLLFLLKTICSKIFRVLPGIFYSIVDLQSPDWWRFKSPNKKIFFRIIWTLNVIDHDQLSLMVHRSWARLSQHKTWDLNRLLEARPNVAFRLSTENCEIFPPKTKTPFVDTKNLEWCQAWMTDVMR